MANDLLGQTLTADEERLLALYREAKEFATLESLPPTTRANALAALAPLGIAVTSLGITLEHLIDTGA